MGNGAGARVARALKSLGHDADSIELQGRVNDLEGEFVRHERQIPADVLRFRGWTGSQLENRYSHWIWRHYASAFWDDVRLDRVLPFKPAKDHDDERHVHPLQLDVIERAVVMWSNLGEKVLTPFMGVGSEVYGAVINDRLGIGAELKESYFRQAKLNMKAAASGSARREQSKQVAMFGESEAAQTAARRTRTSHWLLDDTEQEAS